jgi:hypothetical protein
MHREIDRMSSIDDMSIIEKGSADDSATASNAASLRLQTIVMTSTRELESSNADAITISTRLSHETTASESDQPTEGQPEPHGGDWGEHNEIIGDVPQSLHIYITLPKHLNSTTVTTGSIDGHGQAIQRRRLANESRLQSLQEGDQKQWYQNHNRKRLLKEIQTFTELPNFLSIELINSNIVSRASPPSSRILCSWRQDQMLAIFEGPVCDQFPTSNSRILS